MTRVARSWQIVALLAVCCTVTSAQEPTDPAAALAPPPEPSPLLTEPKTPEEMFAASSLLVDLARFDLAKIYLEQFLAADPADDVYLALREKFGTGEFLRLSRIKTLNPAARTILQRLNQISRMQAADAAFVVSLVARLFGSPTERDLAILELRNAGPPAVPEVLHQLAVRDDAKDRDALVMALVGMDKQVVPVLIGALQSPESSVRTGAIEALQLLKANEATPFLWSLGYSPNSEPGTATAARRALAFLTTGRADRTERLSSSLAVEELRARAWGLYTEQYSLADVLADQPTDAITVWRWDSATERVQPSEVRVQDAGLDLATRLSREALTISPERADLQRLHLGTLLASEVQRTGWDQPMSIAGDAPWQAAVSAGEPILLDVLKDALAWGRNDTAWAALQALNQIASREVLRNSLGSPSPVLAALNSPDPRVQFAAAIVVLRAEPRTVFPSASRVTAILRRALTDPGQARALVIDADKDRGTTVGGFLSEQGYDPVVAVTGRDGFRLAAETAGIELVVIQANVIRWDLTQTVANFRADSRTAFLPLVIYGPEETRSLTHRLVTRNQPATFAADSAAAAAFWEQVQPFVKRFRSPAISGQQRAEFKSLAAYWLATIANGPMSPLFDVTSAETELLPLVEDPDVAANVLSALASIPTAKVQSRLADFALNTRLPKAVRLQATNQLSAHITRYGLVLTADEVDALAQLWGSTNDVELQAALAAVMGTLRPSAGLIGERLRRVTIPARSIAP
jgi:hypothetical protein